MFRWKRRDGSTTVSEVAGQSSSENSKVLMDTSLRDWLYCRIQKEPYWFHKIDLPGGLVTPGWSNPRTEKLPYFGLPEDMTGMRVLDAGHAEGFFSFEAERRGAAEVVGIDNYPPMARKFEICRAALDSRVESHLASVYDLNPHNWGTFDLVMFFGVLYHLRHPILALQKISSVCTGTLLMQTATCQDKSEKPMAEFHPFGVKSGPPENPMHDPTCFWFPNIACCAAMLEHVGFKDVQRISAKAPVGGVFTAKAPEQAKGHRPIEENAPWS